MPCNDIRCLADPFLPKATVTRAAQALFTSTAQGPHDTPSQQGLDEVVATQGKAPGARWELCLTPANTESKITLQPAGTTEVQRGQPGAGRFSESLCFPITPYMGFWERAVLNCLI